MSEHKSSEFGTAVSAIIAVVILIAVVYALTANRFYAMRSEPASAEEVAARLVPVGKVNLAGAGAPSTPAVPAPAASAPEVAAASGEGPGAAIYQKTCFACHATGAANAPKLGDKAAWEPRIAQGMETLVASSLNGKGAMPPKGGRADLADADIRAAVAYMVNEAR